MEENKNNDELYKWELAKDFQKNSSLETEQFETVLKSIDFKNLLSQQASSFLRLAKKNPIEAKEYFKTIFDESKTIKERLKWAKDKGDELIKKWHPKWTVSSQDERTLSIYWSFNDLTRYAPTSLLFYLKYCDLIGVDSKKPGDKYEHYLELLKDLIENYIQKDISS